MKISNILKNRRGITLIELVVVLAILGVISTAVYSFFSYGINTYARGGEKSEIQQNVNLAVTYITNTLRNVKEISVTEKPGYNKLDLQSKYPGIEGIEYTITQVGGEYFLEFIITRDGHSVESKMILNNIKIATLDTGSEVWYLNEPEGVALPQLESITLSAGTLTPTFNSQVTSYTVLLPIGTTNVPSVYATPKDSANYVIEQALNLDGALDERTAIITVTSTESDRTNIYKVVFSVGVSSDATLSSLKVGEVTVNLIPGLTIYTLPLPYGTPTPPTVNAIPNHSGANVEKLTHNNEKVVLEVTAEDEITKRIYTVNYTIAELELKLLSFSGTNKDLTVVFNKNIKEVIERPVNTQIPNISDKTVKISTRNNDNFGTVDHIIIVSDYGGAKLKVILRKGNGNDNWSLVSQTIVN